MVLTPFLATAVSLRLFAAAPDHIWSNGTLLDVDSTRRILANEADSTALTVRRGVLYAVESDRYIYLTEETTNGKRATRLKGNLDVMFRLEGDELFILGDDSVERETRVIKKISRAGEQQVAPLTPPQPASRVLPVDSATPIATAQLEPRQSKTMTQSAPTSAQPAKPRVYVSDSNSWESSGGFTATRGSAAGAFSGGARPQTVEVIKTFSERCPAVVVTMDKAKADFVVLFDREGGKGVAMKRDKIAVFKKEGDVLFSASLEASEMQFKTPVRQSNGKALLWEAQFRTDPTLMRTLRPIMKCRRERLPLTQPLLFPSPRPHKNHSRALR